MTADWDFILAGGGLAGLTLAHRLIRTQAGSPRILILDRDKKQSNDHTWCYWARDSGPYDGLAARTWDRIRVDHPAGPMNIPLGPYRYRMLRSIDLYEHIQADLAASGTVDIRYGEVGAIRDAGNWAEVEAGGEVFRGRWVFNSLFRPGEFVPRPGRYLYLKQHFLGWVIETDRDVFDPDVVTLFDFRTPQRTGLWFFYILPQTARRGLVEYTVFSESILSDEEYRAGLTAYLRDILHAGEYRIVEEERGVIPMTDQPFPRRLGRRILAVGTRGGRVKPSTGYAFRRIQADTGAIAESLRRYGDPFHIPETPLRYRWFDTVMLRMLAGRGDMAGIYREMFRRNPIGRIFRFLDEEGSAAENLALMASLPVGPFLGAGIGLRAGYPKRPVM